MSVLLQIPNCDRNLNRERSKSTECLDDPMYSISEVSVRAQSTQDLSRPGSQHNHSHHHHYQAPVHSSPSMKKSKLNTDDPVLFRSGTTKRRAAIPFSVKYAVSPTRKVVDYNALEGKSPGGKSKATTDLLDLTLMQIKANLSSLHSERIEMEAKLAWILDDIKETQMMSDARGCSRSLSLPEDRLVVRSKSMSRSPNKPQGALITQEDHTLLCADHSDVDVRSTNTSPEGSLAEGKSFLNRRKSMRETRDDPQERRNFFSSSFYRSLRAKKETYLDPSSASSSKSSSLQRGLQRTSSMRQKISSIVKSPTKKLLKNSSPSSSGKNSAVLSKSNVSLSPRILRPDTEVKNQSRDSPHRCSLPESILITTIPEDGFELSPERHTHFTIHHDHFDGPEEKSVASTSALVRRSSLTGQLEHCYNKSSTKRSGEGEHLERRGSEGSKDSGGEVFQRRGSEGGYSTSSETRSMSRSSSARGSIISLSKSPDKRSLKNTVILSGTETTV